MASNLEEWEMKEYFIFSQIPELDLHHLMAQHHILDTRWSGVGDVTLLQPTGIDLNLTLSYRKTKTENWILVIGLAC